MAELTFDEAIDILSEAYAHRQVLGEKNADAPAWLSSLGSSIQGGLSSAGKAITPHLQQAWASPIARNALIGGGLGAAAGGLSGAMSNEGSVLGSALTGGLAGAAMGGGGTALYQGMTAPKLPPSVVPPGGFVGPPAPITADQHARAAEIAKPSWGEVGDKFLSKTLSSDNWGAGTMVGGATGVANRYLLNPSIKPRTSTDLSLLRQGINNPSKGNEALAARLRELPIKGVTQIGANGQQTLAPGLTQVMGATNPATPGIARKPIAAMGRVVPDVLKRMFASRGDGLPFTPVRGVAQLDHVPVHPSLAAVPKVEPYKTTTNPPPPGRGQLPRESVTTNFAGTDAKPGVLPPNVRDLLDDGARAEATRQFGKGTNDAFRLSRNRLTGTEKLVQTPSLRSPIRTVGNALKGPLGLGVIVDLMRMAASSATSTDATNAEIQQHNARYRALNRGAAQ